jgi:hypothetical protein
MLFLVLSLLLNVDAVMATTNNSSTTVSVNQLTTAANNVTSYYKTNKKLPSYVTISGKKVTMPQLLYLMAGETAKIAGSSTGSLTIRNVSMPTKPVETLTKGSLPKSEYVSLAKSLKKFVESYGKLPNYLSTSSGKMKFETSLDMYNRIILFYKSNKRLPTYVSVSPWTGKNYTLENESNPSLVEVTVTTTQLNDAVITLKAFIENNNKIPTTVSLVGQKVTIAQFLELLAHRILNINNKLNNSLTTQKIYMATNPTEDIKSGNINKTEYIKLAGNLTSFSSTNNRIPNYMNTTLGNMRYESAVYLFLKVISFYNTNNRLPSYVSISPWTGTTTSGTGSGIMRPIYIISDVISNSATDNARIDAIVNQLQNLGLTAFNYGAGTDNIGILSNSSLPINALVVEICGGACAGTLYEMGTTWYKNLKGTKKVFMVFTDGATRITGLDWLPRAHDDNFSPESFTGLANPDQYLTNNGYKYYEGYNSSKLEELVQILYNEATSQ